MWKETSTWLITGLLRNLGKFWFLLRQNRDRGMEPQLEFVEEREMA